MSNAVTSLPKHSIIQSMAEQFHMERTAFEATLKKTILPANVSNEEMCAFLIVAKEYQLNPFTKEIYGFPIRGGIQPIVSIDGWLKIINSHKQFDGMEFTDNMDKDGLLTSVTCKMYRKDRSHPVEVTEYRAECSRATEPWKKYPARMLRHKAAIQAARYAFSFSGIVDPDEAERIVEMGEADVVGQISGDPVNMEDVNKAAQEIKAIIDADQIEIGWADIGTIWHDLSNDEQMEVNNLLGDKAPDSKRMYRTILKDYLGFVPE